MLRKSSAQKAPPVTAPVNTADNITAPTNSPLENFQGPPAAPAVIDQSLDFSKHYDEIFKANPDAERAIRN